MKFAQKIKILRKDYLKLKSSDFAEMIGIARQTVSSWENGRSEPDPSAVLTICNKCKLPENYFDDVEWERDRKNITINSDDCVTIEHIGLKPECGTGVVLYDEPEIKPIQLGRELIAYYLRCSNPDNLKAFTCSGDSMADTIEDGHTVLVDAGYIDAENAGVYVFTIDNIWRIKRLRKKINGELEIISDNPKYSTEVIKPSDDVEIVIKGKVIHNLSRGL